MDSRTLISLLKKAGWREAKGRGSGDHVIFVKKGQYVTVPHPKKDLPAGTLHAILKHAGLK